MIKMISTTDHHRRKCDAKHLAVFPVPSKHLIDIWGERPWISDILESLDYNFYTKLWIVPKTKCSLSQMEKFSVAACFDKTDIKFSFSFMKIPILHSRMSYLKQPILKVKMSKSFFVTWILFFEARVLFSFVRWNWHDAAAASASTRRWWRLVDWGRVTPLSAPRPTTHLTKDDKKW